jgi:hypothetical protein
LSAAHRDGDARVRVQPEHTHHLNKNMELGGSFYAVLSAISLIALLGVNFVVRLVRVLVGKGSEKVVSIAFFHPYWLIYVSVHLSCHYMLKFFFLYFIALVVEEVNVCYG